MPKALMIEEAERRHPDMVRGQKWKSTKVRYWFNCGISRHGRYFQIFEHHNSGAGCPKCGRALSVQKRSVACGTSRTPEYGSVRNHFYRIIKNPIDACKGMPFFDDWNPRKGGSYLAGYRWIIENIGPRPVGRTLHIIKHSLGFVPGNLAWAYPKKQSAERMFRIITCLEHENAQKGNEVDRLRKQVPVTLWVDEKPIFARNMLDLFGRAA